MSDSNGARPPLTDNVPPELRALRQWVCANAKKVPFNPRTGELANVTDPSTWASYDEAVAAGAPHVGLVLTKNDPYCFIDLDEPANAERRKAGTLKDPTLRTAGFFMELDNDILAHLFASVTRRIDSLESELAATREQLAQTKFLRYVGVWEQDKQYQPGDVATWDGCMWACTRSTITKPGEGRSGWQLAVKRGKRGANGRDAR